MKVKLSKQMFLFSLLFLFLPLFPFDVKAEKKDKSFEFAQELMANRSYEKAYSHFEKFAKKHPKDKQSERAYLYMGRASYLTKKYRRAVQIYLAFLKKYPKSPLLYKAQFLLAKTYEAQKNYHRAATIYLNSSDRLQAQAYLQEFLQNYLDLAEEFYRGKKVIIPGPIKKTKIVRDYTKALNFYLKALNFPVKKKAKPQIYHKIAFCYFHLSNYDQAIEQWKKLLKEFPKTKLLHEVHYYLGQSYFKRRSYNKARKHLKIVIKKFGDSKWVPFAYRTLGQTYSPFSTKTRKALDKALSYWEVITKRYPTHKITPQVSFDMARACYSFGLYDQAIQKWQEFLDGYRKNKLASKALYQIAVCHNTLQHYQKARAVWKQFLSQFPTDKLFSPSLKNIAQSYYNQGLGYFSQKKYQKAVEIWNQYLLKYPLGNYVPTILTSRGDMAFSQKKYQLAIKHWRVVAFRYAGQTVGARAQIKIAKTRFLLKDLQGAVGELVQLIRAFPYSSYARRARKILREMREKILRVETKRVYTTGEKAFLHIKTRNISQLTLRLYRLDLKEYFFKKHRFQGMEDLLIEVVAPDKKITLKVPGFQKYQVMEKAYDMTKYLGGAGAYIITVEGGEYKAKTLVIISDITLITKHSPKQILVFAQNEITGKPAPSVPIYLSDGSTIFAKGKTNGQGIFVKAFSYQRRDVRVFGCTKKHYALSSARVSNLVTFGYKTRGYVYTDRPVYRPGQTVNFKAIVRKVSAGVYQTPVGAKVAVKIKNNNDIPIYEKVYTLDSFGALWGKFQLTEKPPLGQYTVEITYKEKDKTIHNFSGSFYVEEYKKPEMIVAIDTGQPNLLYEEKIKAKVNVKYYFGGPVKKAPLQYTLFRKNYRFDATMHKKNAWFFDKKIPQGSSSYSYLLRGVGQTDGKGRFSITLPTDVAYDCAYLLQVRVLGANRRWVSGSRTFYMTSQGYYAILQANKKVIWPRESISLDLLTVGANHGPLSRKGKIVVLKRMRRESGRLSKRGTIHSGYAEEKIYSIPIVTGDNGRTSTKVTLTEPGEYALVFLGVDRQKNTVEGRATVFVSGEAKNLRKEARLVAQKTVYTTGEKAEFLINSPVAKTYCLITFEGEQVLDYYVKYLAKKSTMVRIPLTSKHAPNVTISLAIAHKNKLYKASDEIMVFQFLNISLKKNKSIYKPGEKVTYKISTTDQRGKAISAQISLGVVDSAVYALRPDATPAIKPYFYNQRRKNSVVTACSYQFKYLAKTKKMAAEILKERERRNFETNYKKYTEALKKEDRSKYKDAKLLLSRGAGRSMDGFKSKKKRAYRAFKSPPKPSAKSPSLGYDGEDEDEGAGSDKASNSPSTGLAKVEVRKRFADTAFWNGHLQTDKQGKKTLTFPMVQNITTWRVTARGVTAKSLVGQATDSFVTTRAFLVRLETPRFITQKDQLTISTLVHNRTANKVRFASDIQAQGASLEGPSKISDTLKGYGKKRYNWKISAPHAGLGAFRARASTGKLGDGTMKVLSILPHGLAYQRGISGILENSTFERIKLPANTISNEFQIRFTPSVSRSFPGAIEFLQSYPYGCIEQTINKFLPALMARKALGSLSQNRQKFKKNLDKAVKMGLVRIYNSQNSDGGWGWWRGRGSRPTLSAYAYLALAEAWRGGYKVYHPVIQKGKNYLTRRFYQASFDGRALIVYALSRGYSNNYRLSNAIYRYRANLSPYGLALLAMTYKNMGWHAKARKLVSLLLSKAIEKNGQVFWKGGKRFSWYDSSLESTAYALKALIEIQPSSPLAPRVVRWIMARRTGPFWATTKATAAVIQGLSRWAIRKLAGLKKFQVTISINGKKALKKTFSPRDFQRGQGVLSLSTKGLKVGWNSIKIQARGLSSPIFYSGKLSGFVQGENFKPRGYALTVKRRYIPYRAPGTTTSTYQPGYTVLEPSARPKVRPPKSISKIQSGKRWTVVLDLYSKYTLEYVKLEDLLPAGAEVDKGKESGNMDHMEVRDEKVAFFVTRLSRGHSQIRYTLVAIHPGQYHVLPANISPMYIPQIFGSSSELGLQILERPVKVNKTRKKITPDEIYQQARKAFEKKDYKKILALMTELLPLKLRRAIRVEALYMSLLSYLYLNYSKEAVSAYEKLYELDVNKASLSGDLIQRLARSYYNIHQYERALHFYTKVVRLAFQRELALVSEYQNLGRPLSAQAFTARVLGRFPDEDYLINQWYSYSTRFLSLKRKAKQKYRHFKGSLRSPYMLEEGFVHLKEFTSLYPNHGLADDAHYQCILTRYKQKRYFGLTTEADFFIQRYPKSYYLDDVYYYKMNGHFKRKEYKKAIQAGGILIHRKFKKSAYQRAHYSSYRWAAFYLLGKIYHTQGKFKKALTYYKIVKNRYEDARLAYQFFTRKELYMKDYAIFGLGEPAKITLKYKNLSKAQFKIYKVDLMMLFALKGSLQNFHKIDLTGITPQKKWKTALAPFDDYRVHPQEVEVPLSKKGTYLLVARVGHFDKTVILIKSKIRLSVQKERNKVTVYATHAKTRKPLNRVYIKVSVNGRFIGSGFTDSRGVFSVYSSYYRNLSVLAEKDGHYGLYRSK